MLICIYIYVCMNVCKMYLCIYVFMYTCTYIYIYICTYVYMYYVHMYRCICIYVCMYMDVHLDHMIQDALSSPREAYGIPLPLLRRFSQALGEGVGTEGVLSASLWWWLCGYTPHTQHHTTKGTGQGTGEEAGPNPQSQKDRMEWEGGEEGRGERGLWPWLMSLNVHDVSQRMQVNVQPGTPLLTAHLTLAS